MSWGGGYLTKERRTFQDEKANTILAIYNEDTRIESIPSKDSKLYFDREKSKCSDGTRIEWDSETWSPVIERIPSSINTRLSCEIHFTKEYHEGILNGMDPVIKGDLTPVTIDNNGTVRKADLNEAWYSYSNKEWANSIILQNSYESLNAYGNVHGATKKDGYVSLDGQDDYINLGLENYDFQNGITMAIKLQFNDLSKKQEFFGNWEGAGGGCAVDGGLYCNMYDSNTKDYIFLFFTKPNINIDYTILFTYDNNALKLYINGEEVDSQVYSGNITQSTMPILIGANPNSDGNHGYYSNIDVKQAAIFNRAITEEEIAKMKEDIKITDSNGLLKYVDFTNKKGNEYEPKEVIPEDVIESYFVWIPKYRYQLFNLGNYKEVINLGNIPSSSSVPNNSQEIKIKFGDYNTVNGYKECETPTTSNNGSCKIGDYMTHPAFTAFEGSTGFWVGKFETGYLGAKNASEAQVNKEETSKIIIKPNVYSWREINVSNAFTNSQKYQSTLDSHMMKNSEWGAVAYLTNSRYGRCNGVSCSEVRMNNSQNYVTGASNKNEPTCGYTGTNEGCNRYEDASLTGDTTNINNYFNVASQISSTTGNYTGIYDMAGGSWDYVMGVMQGGEQDKNPASGADSSSNSGFKGPYSNNSDNGSKIDGIPFPDSKYYDLYDYNISDKEYQRGIIGDSTKEAGPFYLVGYPKTGNTYNTRQVSSYNVDLSDFVNSGAPWFRRGGARHDGTDVGVFAFNRYFGNEVYDTSFRIILTPIN